MASLEEHTSEVYGMDDSKNMMGQSTSPRNKMVMETSSVIPSLDTIPEYGEPFDDLEIIGYISVIKMHFGANLPAGRFGGRTAHAPAILQDGGAQGEDGRTDTGTPGYSVLYPAWKTAAEPQRQNRRGSAVRIGELPIWNDATGFEASIEITPAKLNPFLNISAGNVQEYFSFENPAYTSTPICGQKMLTTPLRKQTTPKKGKENIGQVDKELPSITPTPFKNALAAQEKKYGPLKVVSQPLAYLEEDIREVLKQETGKDIFLKEEDDEPGYRAQKQRSAVKKVRKSLILDAWDKDELGAQLLADDTSDLQVTVGKN
ncbi:unnamed protein product [Ranitomeya imitator]|uniref:C-myb C-terminal domain-containing protein n=1 Tax=Ranitomeya imitator TaxID=111125 RepID=A0ABN9MDE8_9NEOB|nr:unnamed protein product [Ranitomeya imitator]